MKNQWILVNLIMFFNVFSSLNQRYDIIICVNWIELFSQVSDVAHGPLVIFKDIWVNWSKVKHIIKLYPELWENSANVHVRSVNYLFSSSWITMMLRDGILDSAQGLNLFLPLTLWHLVFCNILNVTFFQIEFGIILF